MKYVDEGGVFQGPTIWVHDLIISSKVTSLGTLEFVDGYLDVSRNPNLVSLGKLRKVTGTFRALLCVNLKSLGHLTSVGRAIDLDGCKKLESTGALEKVGATLWARGAPMLREIKGLQYVGGSLNVDDFSALAGHSKLRFRAVCYTATPPPICVREKEFRACVAKIEKAPLLKLASMLSTVEFPYRVLVEHRLKGYRLTTEH